MGIVLSVLVVLAVVGSVVATVWLMVTGQAAGVEGLFLLASSLVMALVLGLCLRFTR